MYPFTGYKVLGDDVVINDKAVGETYLNYLSIFDIPVSLEKTMVSEDTYEFAKRWFIKGIEVSPFPVNGIFEESKHYFTLRNLLYTVNRKGFRNFDSEEPNRELIMNIWDIFGKTSQKERLYKKFLIFDAINRKNDNVLLNRLNTLYPKEHGGTEEVQKLIRRSKVLTSLNDILSLQKFYNSELNALKQGHVVEKYKKLKEDDQAAPAYEYADV
jgi:hypothetical protein